MNYVNLFIFSRWKFISCNCVGSVVMKESSVIKKNENEEWRKRTQKNCWKIKFLFHKKGTIQKFVNQVLFCFKLTASEFFRIFLKCERRVAHFFILVFIAYDIVAHSSSERKEEKQRKFKKLYSVQWFFATDYINIY